MEQRVIWESERVNAGGGNSHDGQSFSVVLYENEIAYDVEVATWAMTMVHFADKTDKERQHAVVGQELKDWLYRQVESALAKFRSEVSFAMRFRSNVAQAFVDDEVSQWTVPLRIEGWRGDADVLGDLLHDYVSKYVVLQWCRLRFPGVVGALDGEVDELLRRCKAEVYKVKV